MGVGELNAGMLCNKTAMWLWVLDECGAMATTSIYHRFLDIERYGAEVTWQIASSLTPSAE